MSNQNHAQRLSGLLANEAGGWRWSAIPMVPRLVTFLEHRRARRDRLASDPSDSRGGPATEVIARGLADAAARWHAARGVSVVASARIREICLARAGDLNECVQARRRHAASSPWVAH